MHVAQQLAEGNVIFKVKDVTERLHLCGVVVEHQQDACEGEYDEQIKSDAAHAPGKFIFDGVAIDLRGMQVKENVRQDGERAVARGLIVLDAENRAEKLRLFGLF